MTVATMDETLRDTSVHTGHHADQQILRSIRANLARIRPSLEITFQVTEGVVLIQGTVHSFYEKQCAQEAARKVSGVSQVVNTVEVKAG